MTYSESDPVPRISVVTPSWNRAEYLSRVFAGLCAQSYRSFEWIVGNDGSCDNTNDVVAQLSEAAEFPVVLIEASVRIGKSSIDNILVNAARGEFVIWCDSDDVLNPAALSSLVAAWEEIPVSARDEYMGVSARAETPERILGNKLSAHNAGGSWNDIYAALGSDLLIMSKSELLKDHPFLEVDFLIPETSMWNLIGTRRSIFIDKPLLTKHYRQPNALSFTGKMQYSRGRAYALGRNYPYVKKNMNIRGELLRSVNFVRYCIHGEVSFSSAVRNWLGSPVSHAMLVLGFLPAMLLSVRDKLRGVVDKTHIEFEANRHRVTVTNKISGGRM